MRCENNGIKKGRPRYPDSFRDRDRPKFNLDEFYY